MMPRHIPESDRSPHGDAPAGEEPPRVSRLALVVGILVMLLPACVPLYFAFLAEGTAVIVLVGAAIAVALMNTLLVYGIWSWANSY